MWATLFSYSFCWSSYTVWRLLLFTHLYFKWHFHLGKLYCLVIALDRTVWCPAVFLQMLSATGDLQCPVVFFLLGKLRAVLKVSVSVKWAWLLNMQVKPCYLVAAVRFSRVGKLHCTITAHDKWTKQLLIDLFMFIQYLKKLTQLAACSTSHLVALI